MRTPRRAHLVPYIFTFQRSVLFEVAFIAHHQAYHVLVAIVFELFQPFLQILKGRSPGDVVDKQGPNRSPVVGTGHGSVSLLSGSVPDLNFDRLPIDVNHLGGKFDPDCGLALQVELVFGEPGYDIGFAYS